MPDLACIEDVEEGTCVWALDSARLWRTRAG